MRQYMVVSRDAVDNRIRTSEHFPKIVYFNDNFNYSSEEILSKVFWPATFNAREGKQYFIVPMDDARLVTCHKRKPEYYFHSERING